MIFQYLTFFFDSTRSLYYKADELIRSGQYDYLIVSGGPFILFKYGYLLNKNYNINWIADYRDGWSNNYLLNNSSFLKKVIYRFFYSRLEKKYLKKVSLISSVSRPLLMELTETHTSKNYLLIRNGYDTIELDPRTTNRKKNNRFSIAYGGTVLSYQRLDVFMKGVNQFLLKTQAKINITFYGLRELEMEHPHPASYLDKRFSSFVELTNILPYEEVMKKMSQADLLILLANEKVDGSCTKVYDYLYLNRKILLSSQDLKQT